MKFTQINPEGRLVFLSATMPNVTEIGQWMSWLTRRNTVVLESTYRPCPLHVHYEKYYEVNFGYEENERSKIRTAIEIMNKHPKDKFLLFVHTKRTGDMLASRLKELGIQCEYHNADLTKDKRIQIERRFKEDCKLRCIVATSTLAWGTNLPARRVIVLGVHRGMSDVATYDIAQMIGRAGRPQYDPQGDAYILLPSRSFYKHKERLESPQLIESQISDAKCLAFHLTSEIHHNTVKSQDDIQEWYERSLAFHQDNTLNQEAVEQAIKRLTICGAITEKNKNFDVTSIGTVASMFYYSPFDISDLARNFGKVFERRKEDSDYWVAMALGNVDSLKFTNASNADKEDMAKFKKGVEETGCERVFCGSREFTDGALKAGCCYYNLLKGYNSTVLGATMRGMQADAERLCEVLCAIDQMVGKWDQKEYIRRLYLRILYGVEEEMVSLCCLKGVGKIKAKRLWDANLRTWEDISTNALGVIKALSCSKNVAEQICENAKELIARESTK
jgi:helicase